MATGQREFVKRRTVCLFVVFLFLYLAVCGRLAYVQVIKRSEYKKWADSIRSRNILVRASRGRICDRNGQELAVSIETASVYANRNEIEDADLTASRLGKMLGKDPKVILKKLEGTSTIVWLARRIDPRIGDEIKSGYIVRVRRKTKTGWQIVEKRERIPGIGVESDTKRIYPSGELAGQILGFTNFENKGSEGLEYVRNEDLSGKNGLISAELDAQRRIIPETRHTVREPVDGKDIRLTIDVSIQHTAEQALANMAKTYHPVSANAIVMDPDTGEILALANYPSYDPNSPAKVAPGVWRNRAVADLYEPGSTLKVVTVAAGLNEGMSPYAVMAYCTGREKIKGGRITCTLHHPYEHGHGSVDMYKIIQESCNIGAAHIALRMGSEKLYSYEKAFGLLDRTDAGFGCEAVGNTLPAKDWRLIRLANIGFGQGIAVTALQMASVYATIANGGTYVQPQIIREVRSADGKIIKPFKAKKLCRVISEKASMEMKRMLLSCVLEGTGKPAKIPGRTVAGKTGSAQIAKPRGGYESGQFISSFMGFVPAMKPKLVIAVVVNKPHGSHWGATVAAPVFQEIGKNAAWRMRIPADAPVEQKEIPRERGGRSMARSF